MSKSQHGPSALILDTFPYSAATRGPYRAVACAVATSGWCLKYLSGLAVLGGNPSVENPSYGFDPDQCLRRFGALVVCAPDFNRVHARTGIVGVAAFPPDDQDRLPVAIIHQEPLPDGLRANLLAHDTAIPAKPEEIAAGLSVSGWLGQAALLAEAHAAAQTGHQPTHPGHHPSELAAP